MMHIYTYLRRIRNDLNYAIHKNNKKKFIKLEEMGSKKVKSGILKFLGAKYDKKINISTYAVFEPEKNFPTSGVMRAGLSSFVKIYSDEYAKYNIRINNILPGFIESLKPKKEFLKRVPLKRAGKVIEISTVVKLLASDNGSYITGQNIRVDGGITRSI